MATRHTRRTVAAGIMLTPLATAACGVLGPSHLYLFKVRAYLTVAGVSRVCSTVIKSRWDYYGKMLDSGDRWVPTGRGDAIAIPIAQGRMAFGLLDGIAGGTPSSLNIDDQLFRAFLIPNRPNEDAFFERIGELKGEVDLPPRYWPVLVGFSNISKLETAILLDTQAANPGFPIAISRVTISLTNEEEKDELRTVLHWLDTVDSTPKNYRVSSQQWPTYMRLYRKNFHLNGDRT